ncbi:MAG: L,D-transpeptidase [Coriobacteriia bacterium]|nr:L,D-transpeptidase [Coriobacteriia bacterium]
MGAKNRNIALVLMLSSAMLFAFVGSAQASAAAGVTSFTVTVGGKKFTLSPSERNAIVGSKSPADITKSTMTPSQKAALVKKANAIAKDRTSKAKNIRYAYSSKEKKMVIINASTGYSLSSSTVQTAMYSALGAFGEAKYTGAVAATVSRRITKAGLSKRVQLGKCIVVDKSACRLYLYDHGVKTNTTYRVTVGKAGHRTPSGYYTIGTKRLHPTWGNPGSAWASGMPKTIAAGPNNPLGIRAMNLNQNGHDTGLRIHGTSNKAQIGTAASHGCIRVANANIVKLYPKIPKGTPVIVKP